jgi:hypothetical protein
VVVLIAAAFGLSMFWNYMDAYEDSRIKKHHGDLHGAADAPVYLRPLRRID